MASHSGQRCYKCGQEGHWAQSCPDRLRVGAAAPPPAPVAAAAAPADTGQAAGRSSCGPALVGGKRVRDELAEVAKVWLGGVYKGLDHIERFEIYLRKAGGFRGGVVEIELDGVRAHVTLKGTGANRAAHRLTAGGGYHRQSGLFAQAKPHNTWYCPHDGAKVTNLPSCDCCGRPRPSFEAAARAIDEADGDAAMQPSRPPPPVLPQPQPPSMPPSAAAQPPAVAQPQLPQQPPPLPPRSQSIPQPTIPAAAPAAVPASSCSSSAVAHGASAHSAAATSSAAAASISVSTQDRRKCYLTYRQAAAVALCAANGRDWRVWAEDIPGKDGGGPPPSLWNSNPRQRTIGPI